MSSIDWEVLKQNSDLLLLLQEQFTAMRDLYMKNGEGFIIVYSVTDPLSLTEATDIFQNLVRVRQKYHVGFFNAVFSSLMIVKLIITIFFQRINK